MDNKFTGTYLAQRVETPSSKQSFSEKRGIFSQVGRLPIMLIRQTLFR